MSPPPGTIGLTATPDWEGRCIRWGTRSRVNHTFICLGEDRLFEARPRGAGVGVISGYPGAFFREDIILTEEQRAKIINAVLGLEGTPYGWADIAALTLWCLLGRRLPGWAQRKIEDSRTLICSQLVDRVYLDAGIHLFADHRMPGAVTPGDLVDCHPGSAQPPSGGSPGVG